MNDRAICEVCNKEFKLIRWMNEDERKTYDEHKLWACTECVEKHKLCKGCLAEGLIIKRGELKLQGNPPCNKHVENKLYLLVLNFIKTRIADLGSEDKSRGQFVIRELVQNADDEEAKMIVLRFQNDALYVANDGKAFSGEDWMNIREILGGHKETVKTKSGHFGSGFQTVYAFTNAPEVHSNGISRRMNPIDGNVDEMGDDQQLTSPYIENLGNKGSLFRFPWRDDKAALQVIGGRTYFKDEQDWPRWNNAQMEELFEDLIEYSHKVFLCCQHLLCMRLVWAIDGENRSYQVRKDFSLHDTKHHLKIGTVRSGYGTTGFSFIDSFQIENWEWKDGKKEYHYLIGSRRMEDGDGREIHIVKVEAQHQSYHKIQPDLLDESVEVKTNLVHILLPLFDCTELLSTDEQEHGVGPYPLYSVIPLPTRTANRFAFTGHFFPTQTRKDVDVAGTLGEWYRLSIYNVWALYKEMFPHLVGEITSRESPTENDQATILNAIPVSDITEWMRPGKAIDESGQNWHKGYKDDLEHLLFSNQIVLDQEDGTWTALEDNYWCNDGQDEVAEILNLRHLDHAVTDHLGFRTLQGPRLEAIRFDDNTFYDEWLATMDLEAASGDGEVRYGSTTVDGVRLDHDNMKRLIAYCFRPDSSKELSHTPIVPGEDHVLRKVGDYPLFDRKYDSLEPLLPPSLKVHKDFDGNVRTIEVRERTRDAKGVLRLISEMVELDRDRYQPMDESRHKRVSDAVSKVILDPGFGLSSDIKHLSFIPYNLGGKTFMGEPNKNDGSLIGIEVGANHLGESQLRTSIFARNKTNVQGMTPEIESKIRFISLVAEEKGLDIIENRLNLVALQTNPDEPTNFVRHFLSPRHGSIFDDKILAEFIGTNDKRVMEGQKRSFHAALKAYFNEGERGKSETYLRRKDMAQVPCLYDTTYAWAPAGRFAYEMYPELDFGFKALHSDLKSWGPDTLLALGVRRSPDGATIAKEVLDIIKKNEPDMMLLANIFAYVLTTDVEEGDAIAELRDMEWVPINGELKKPTDVGVPSRKSIEAVGFRAGLLFNPSCCSKGLKERLEDSLENNDIYNIEHLGCKPDLEFDDLLKAIGWVRSADEEPSKTLFDLIQANISNMNTRKDYEGHGYYIRDEGGGRWVDSRKVLLTDDIVIQNISEMGILVLPSDHQHAKYLKWDGAETEPRGDVVLTMVADGKLDPTEEIWAFLERNKCIYDEGLKARLSDRPIFSHGGEMLAPSSIVMITNEGNHPLGKVGDYYFISTRDSDVPSSTLTGLGARYIDLLSQEDIIAILASIDDSRAMGDDEVRTVLQLIRVTSGMLTSKTLGLHWPCHFGDTIVMSDITKAFIPDDQELLGELLTQKVPVPVLVMDGQRRYDLENPAVRCGAQRVSKEDGLELKKVEVGRKTYNAEITTELRSLGSSTLLEKILEGDMKNFSWLTNVTAYDVEDIRMTYDIGGAELTLGSTRSELTMMDGALELLIIKEEEDLMADCISKVLVSRIRSSDHKVSSKSLDLTRLSIFDRVKKTLSPSPSEPLFTGPLGIGQEPEPQDSENVKRYREVRSRFSDMYGCCQICSRRTPADEYNISTIETVKALVGNRECMFHTDESVKYSIGNTLFLCPTHQTLLGRGLVRFPGMNPDSEPRKMIEDLSQGIGRYQSLDPDEEVPFMCEVFEGKLKDSKWTEWDDMFFRAGHLVEVLENIRSYYQGRLDDEGR